MLAITLNALGYPQDLPCARELTTSTRIMGAGAAMGSEQRASFSGKVCGGVFVAGEELLAQFSATSRTRYVLELSGGATFKDGASCGGKRAPWHEWFQPRGGHLGCDGAGGHLGGLRQPVWHGHADAHLHGDGGVVAEPACSPEQPARPWLAPIASRPTRSAVATTAALTPAKTSA